MLPLPRLTPLREAAPAWTRTFSTPVFLSIPRIARAEPLPISAIAISEATPMTMPRVVRRGPERVPPERPQGRVDGPAAAPGGRPAGRPPSAAGGRRRLAGRRRRPAGRRSGPVVGVVADQAVADPDDPVGVGGDGRVVRHQDDREAVLGVELAEEVEDLPAGLRVEVAGRLVGDQERASLTSARAMATRCCSPPESCEGSWSSRSPRPTRSSSDRARSRQRRPEGPAAGVGSGSSTFSSAVSRGSRLKFWKTKPILSFRSAARCSAREPRDLLAVEPVAARGRLVEARRAG